jgi:high-affinity iron transporter
MLAWHNIWMASHGREMANQAKNTARAIHEGVAERSVIFAVIAMPVLREGSETVLFLYSLSTSSADGWTQTLSGGSTGLLAGALVGGLLYAGLLRIPLRYFFTFTSALVLLLTASMASQAARYLMQADVLPSLGAPVWDTSGVLAQSSAFGTLLHGMVGYNDQPAGIQLVFYVSALVLTAVGMYWAAHKKSGPRRIPDNG